MMLKINGESLQIKDVVAVAEGMRVGLDRSALPKIERCRAAVDQLIADGVVAYGITTGFGRLRDKIIPGDKLKQLQLNLVRSHATGMGPELDEKTVRAMLLVRANTLALGHSGIRPIVIETLLEMLNHGIHPCVPCQGSVGASGDLAPLAHLAIALIGEGEVNMAGQRLPSGEALSRAKIAPIQLQAKEGLALLNGTTLMSGLGALLVDRASNLLFVADVAGCMSLEALHGTDRAYDARVHAARPHPGQVACAASLRRLIAGSQFLRHRTSSNVQDPYTLRCVPQVHGAVRDVVDSARRTIDIELNSADDNPLIFVEEDAAGNETVDVISAGNFHGEPLALAMDSAKIAITDLGNMSERRVARLVDADSNGGVLPMFLTNDSGLESGMMQPHITAAALASENKVLAHPASADTIPTSGNYEDHVSMGTIATRQLAQILDHVESIVAIELLCAAQGIDFRRQRMGNGNGNGNGDAQLGAGTGLAFNLIRSKVPFVKTDVYLRPLMEEVRQLIATGAIRDAVESGWSRSIEETGDPSISTDEWVAPTSEDIPAVVK